MMFIIKQKELIDKLKNVCSVVESKNINDNEKLLDCVSFNVTKEGITLIASSADIQVKAHIKGEFTNENIKFSVNAKYLSESIGTLQSLLDLKFELVGENQQTVVVSSGKTKYNFTNLATNGHDYPILSLKNYDKLFTINNESFKKAIQSVSFAMGVVHLRYFLAGTMMKVVDGKITFVSTDTHRLAYYTISDESIKSPEKSIILPKKTVSYLEKFFSINSGEVSAYLADEDYFVVKNNDFEIISKLIIGAYPEYEKVFTQKHTKSALVNTNTLKDAVNRIAIFAIDKFRTINFAFEVGNLIIEAKSTVNESAKTEIEINYQNEPITMNFNVQYISELLARTEEKECHIDFSDQNFSVIFTFTGNENYKYVLMPLRV